MQGKYGLDIYEKKRKLEYIGGSMKCQANDQQRNLE